MFGVSALCVSEAWGVNEKSWYALMLSILHVDTDPFDLISLRLDVSRDLEELLVATECVCQTALSGSCLSKNADHFAIWIIEDVSCIFLALMHTLNVQDVSDILMHY